MSATSKPAAVYRFYNADGDLLYVGVTSRPVSRLRLHASGTPWFSEVARMEYGPILWLEAARQSERHQILTLEPRYNKRRARQHVVVVSLRIDRDLLERFRARALSKGQTVSEAVRELIDRNIADHGLSEQVAA